MPSSRRLQHPTFSGPGVMSALLAAAAAAFALVSGIVAHDLMPDDSLAQASRSLVLGPLAVPATATRPVVLDGARTARRGERAPGASRSPAPAGGAARGAATSSLAPHAGAVGARRRERGPGAGHASDRVRRPGAAGSASPAGRADATAGSLARRLRAVGEQVLADAQPGARTLERSVARLLGGPPRH